jgi:hypothetical protein
MTTTATTRKNPAKPAVRANTAKSVKVRAMGGQLLTGQALMKDMKAYHKKVVATPKSARDFLTRLGVMTPDGKAKNLIRG